MSSARSLTMRGKIFITLIAIPFAVLILLGYKFMPLMKDNQLIPISIFYYLVIIACLLAYAGYFRWCYKHSN